MKIAIEQTITNNRLQETTRKVMPPEPRWPSGVWSCWKPPYWLHRTI